MKLFGTDGIRGEAGRFPLDDATVFRIGRLLASEFRENRRAVVGGDTRESTPRLMAAISSGLAAGGTQVETAGVVTTPAVADLVLERRAAAGISISASHNPWRDNGIKIFAADGRKWPDEGEHEIESGLDRQDFPRPDPVKDVPPPDPALFELALRRLAKAAPQSLEGFPVLLDCGNGAAFELGPRAFRAAGATVETICASPNGRNINEGCGALHPENLASRFAGSGNRMGASFDGDADRAILCDERGRILDGDDILWILARDQKRAGSLDPPIVVGTVLSNFGLEAALAREGIALERAPVGDRHVVRRMLETGAGLGGEPSGHVIQASLSPTGDGIRTALSIASLVSRTGNELSRLADLVKTPQVQKNVRVEKRVPLDEVVRLASEVARAERDLAGRGRVLLRYSGTEPLLRVMVEGEDAGQVASIAARLCDVAERELGG
jgi:phosphoglucosamine mutase